MVTLVTFQEKVNLPLILEGKYVPNLKYSMGSVDDVALRAYKSIIDKLNKKLGIKGRGDEAPFWGWLSCPYYPNHYLNNYLSPLVAITYKIDPAVVLVTDFDDWCDIYNNGNFKVDCSIKEGSLKRSIQGIHYGLDPKNIIAIEDFNSYIKNKNF